MPNSAEAITSSPDLSSTPSFKHHSVMRKVGFWVGRYKNNTTASTYAAKRSGATAEVHPRSATWSKCGEGETAPCDRPLERIAVWEMGSCRSAFMDQSLCVKGTPFRSLF